MPPRNVSYPVDQKDSVSAAAFGWLCNVPHVFVLGHVFVKEVFFFREHVRQRSELVLFAEVLLHPVHDVAQDLLPCKQFGAWVSIEEEFVACLAFDSRLDDVDVSVAETDSVPDEVAFADAGGLVPSAQVDYILESFSFLSAMSGVDHKLLALFALRQAVISAAVKPVLNWTGVVIVEVRRLGFGQFGFVQFGFVFLALLRLDQRSLVESLLIFLLLNSCEATFVNGFLESG